MRKTLIRHPPRRLQAPRTKQFIDSAAKFASEYYLQTRYHDKNVTKPQIFCIFQVHQRSGDDYSNINRLS